MKTLKDDAAICPGCEQEETVKHVLYHDSVFSHIRGSKFDENWLTLSDVMKFPLSTHRRMHNGLMSHKCLLSLVHHITFSRSSTVTEQFKNRLILGNSYIFDLQIYTTILR